MAGPLVRAAQSAVDLAWALPGMLTPQRSPKAGTDITSLIEALESAGSKTGVSVTIDTTLQCAAAWACARVLANGVSQVPAKIMRETENGSEPARDLPLYEIVHRRPNAWMTSFDFRQTLMLHLVLTGNAYAVKSPMAGMLRELIPVLPTMVTVKQNRLFELSYEVRDSEGLIATLPASAIMHLRGPSWNAYVGYDALKLLREAVGLAIATEEGHARLHKHGVRPSGILSTDLALDEEQLKRIKTAWAEAYGGVGSVGRTLVLDAGMKWAATAMTGVDAQHIETRKFQIEEICRAMGVFPALIGASDKATTYASAEQFFTAHVIHSLGPWVELWEQTIDRDLIPRQRPGQPRLFAKFNVKGLMRGDNKSRSAFYHEGILDGWITRNEVRELEDMNRLPGLDEPLQPLNTEPVSEEPDDQEGTD